MSLIWDQTKKVSLPLSTLKTRHTAKPAKMAGVAHTRPYRGTLPIRNSLPLGTYSSICIGPYGGPRGGGGFL